MPCLVYVTKNKRWSLAGLGSEFHIQPVIPVAPDSGPLSAAGGACTKSTSPQPT